MVKALFQGIAIGLVVHLVALNEGFSPAIATHSLGLRGPDHAPHGAAAAPAATDPSVRGCFADDETPKMVTASLAQRADSLTFAAFFGDALVTLCLLDVPNNRVVSSWTSPAGASVDDGSLDVAVAWHEGESTTSVVVGRFPGGAHDIQSMLGPLQRPDVPLLLSVDGDRFLAVWAAPADRSCRPEETTALPQDAPG